MALASSTSLAQVRLISQTQRRCAARCSASAQQGRAQQVEEPSRRSVLLSAATLLSAASLAAAPAAKAGLVQDLLKQNLRPELSTEDALIQLLDARGVLYEIKALAELPQDSAERRKSNSLLPGYATRLRAVGNAAPAVAALAKGTDKEAQVSSQFGSEEGDGSLTDPIFITVGQVLNYSGRGLREEAVVNPAFAAAAISAVEDLVNLVPPNSLASAQAARAARVAK